MILPNTLTLTHNMGVCAGRMGDFDSAKGLFTCCIDFRIGVLGEDHPDTLMTLSSLAGVYCSNGEYETALLLYEKCLEKRQRVLVI